MPKTTIAADKAKNFGPTVKRFIHSLEHWRWGVLLAVVVAAGAAICSLFGPKLLGEMTTTAVTSYQSAGAIDWDTIGSIAVTLIILYAVSAALSYIEGLILTLVTARYTRRLRSLIIEKIARLPISYFDQHQFGDTLSRMSNDIGIIANTLATVLTQIITSITMVVGILIMMLTISVSLSVVALIVVPVSLLLVSRFAKLAQKYFRNQQVTLGTLNNTIEEDYAGQSIIKANSHEDLAFADFAHSNQRLYESSWKAQFYSSIAFPIVHVCTNLSYVAICVIGGQQAIAGILGIGSVQAFIQYVSQFNRPLSSISQITASIQQAVAAAERVFTFLDEPEEAPDPEPAQVVCDVKGAVEFHDVNFSYHPERPIIKHFSVKIEPGMQVAIVGPTGAGKTTLINLLMRFYDPSSGYITIDGVPTREMRRADVRKLFGMVLQDTWLFSGTIEENLAYGNANATHADIVAATKASSIHHFIESLSHGYDTQISEDSDNISAGEKQLLTIARAMVANPPMMILDEATSNVDTRTEQLIQDAFTKLTAGRTSFVIAHRLSTIRNSDLILVMRDGNIVEQGTHDQLLQQNGFYAELYNSQFADN